jgi:hypothetical protein
LVGQFFGDTKDEREILHLVPKTANIFEYGDNQLPETRMYPSVVSPQAISHVSMECVLMGSGPDDKQK